MKALIIVDSTATIYSRSPYMLQGVEPLVRAGYILGELGVEDVLLLCKSDKTANILRSSPLTEFRQPRFLFPSSLQESTLLTSSWLEMGEKVLLIHSGMLVDPRVLKTTAGQSSTTLLLSPQTDQACGDERSQDKSAPASRWRKAGEKGGEKAIAGILTPDDLPWVLRHVGENHGDWDGLLYSLSNKQSTKIIGLSEIPAYHAGMRRKIQPYYARLTGPDSIPRIKYELVETSSKGASDALAHYVHRPIENALVRRLLPTRATPNLLTLLSNVAAYAATVLYLLGFLVPGLAVSFMVGILDGLDGKLARARASLSKLGVIEHSLDLFYEFSWIVALAVFFSTGLTQTLPLLWCSLILLNISFYRSCYDQFRKSMGRSLDDYGSFERIFRRVAGRRNLYNLHILAWLLVGMPRYILPSILVHAAITSVIYSTRAAIHMHRSDRKMHRPQSRGIQPTLCNSQETV